MAFVLVQDSRRRFVFSLLSAITVIGGGGFAFYGVNKSKPTYEELYGDDEEEQYNRYLEHLAR